MPRVSRKALREMAVELLELRQFKERYEALEKDIKAALASQNLTGEENAIAVNGGRVWITSSERTAIPVELAVAVLGQALAAKVIEVKTSVSNDQVKAFIKAGDIGPDAAEKLDAGAQKTPVVSLFVRPLK